MNSDFWCPHSTLESNSPFNLEMTSLAISCANTSISDSLSSKFPNLRRISLRSVKDFTIFRFCPNLVSVCIDRFRVTPETSVSVFDDLKWLTNLESFEFEGEQMTVDLYAELLIALPKTLVELMVHNFYFANILEACMDFVSAFRNLEILQFNWRRSHFSSSGVCFDDDSGMMTVC